jgi:ATP-binding cassette subfamily B protein/subfamily B ATP-binding cassette protein MsbA
MKQFNSSKRRFKQFREWLKDRDTQPSGSGDQRSDTSIEEARRHEQRRRPQLTREERRKYLRHYFTWLKPYRWQLFGMFVLSLVAIVAGSIRPILFQQVVDHAILANDLLLSDRIWLLNVLGGVMLFLTLAGVLIGAIESYWTTLLNAKIIFRLRQRLFNHLLHLSLDELSTMKSGGLISRLSGDVDSAAGFIQQALLSPVLSAVRALVALGIIFVWNWRLALATTLVIVPLATLHFLTIRRIRPIFRSVRSDRALVDGRVAETFSGVRVVRTFRRETREGKDYAVGHHTVIRKNIYATLVRLAVNSAWGLLMPGVGVVIIWYGGYLVMRDQATGAANPTTVGQLFAFQSYTFMLLQPVMQIVNSFSQTQSMLAAMERVFDTFEKPVDKPDVEGAVDAPERVESITFDNLSFAYGDTPVIRNLNLHVPGGSVVALVGPSGAGKSTLTDLIARFYDPKEGRILLNGVDLRDIQLKSYRQLLGVVEQEVFLFDGSVRDNIAYGRREATDEMVVDAARRANAHDFIEAMDEGYDTIIGERGVKLSGGQRQRLSIARALLADPSILILDEATSSLDSESEHLIQEALKHLYKDRTTFVIAHRLSTVTGADMIVVLVEGEIVELGTHPELMALGGVYERMVARQRDSFATLNQG